MLLTALKTHHHQQFPLTSRTGGRVIGISRSYLPPERLVVAIRWTFSGLAGIAAPSPSMSRPSSPVSQLLTVIERSQSFRGGVSCGEKTSDGFDIAFYNQIVMYLFMAEREGFEPPVPRKGQLISSQPRSATPAPLRLRGGIIVPDPGSLRQNDEDFRQQSFGSGYAGLGDWRVRAKLPASAGPAHAWHPGRRRTRGPGHPVRGPRYTLGETTPSGAGCIGTCPGCAATRASQAVTFG